MINLVKQRERERSRRALNQREHNTVGIEKRHAIHVRRVHVNPRHVKALRIQPRVASSPQH